MPENKPSYAELEAQIASMKQAAAAKVQVTRSKATDKDGNPTKTRGNAVSITGLRRFPITLYREEAEALFADPRVGAEVLAIASLLPTKAEQS
jgi:hypothetical protein